MISLSTTVTKDVSAVTSVVSQQLMTAIAVWIVGEAESTRSRSLRVIVALAGEPKASFTSL